LKKLLPTNFFVLLLHTMKSAMKMTTFLASALMLETSNALGCLVGPWPCILVPLCMHESSTVITPNGPARVDQIKAGDMVASHLPGGHMEYVEVALNSEYTGQFEFMEFAFADGKSLNITSNHVMAVEKSIGASVSMAADVRVGDKMYVRSPNGLRPMEVTSLRKFEHERKYHLVTKNAAVIVDNVLTTTICDASVETLPLGLEEARAFWLASHQSILN